MGVRLGSFVIAEGAFTSNVIGGRVLRTTHAIEIHSPGATTGTIYVTSADQLAETSFTKVQSGGADVTVPAGKVLVMTVVPAHALRLLSNILPEASERIFPVFVAENPHR